MVFYRHLQVTKPKKDWEDYFELIFISIISYLIYSLFLSLFTWDIKLASALTLLSNDKSTLNFLEVFAATIIAIPIAYFTSYCTTNSFINKIGLALRVTKRFGDEDLWHNFNKMEDIDWVTVRDHKENLYYLGYVHSFSETEKRRELIMKEVTVYGKNSDVCYDVDTMYISRNFDDITIEHRKVDSNNANKK